MAQAVVEAIEEDAYEYVGKVFDTQFVVEENVEEALACVRNVAIDHAVVDERVDEAYPYVGYVADAIEIFRYVDEAVEVET